MKKIPNDLFFASVEAEIAEGRSVRFRLRGISMFPLLRDGRDEVVLRPCCADELHPMDVVLFRYRGQHLLHRILRREGDRLYIQGDGSYVAHEECTVADVVGKVHTVIRPSGKAVAVTSWRWRLLSACWRKTGVCRRFFLRVLHYLYRKMNG